MASNGLAKNIIHITNIPWTVGCRELGLYFSQFGCLIAAFVAFDHKTGFHQGYGHVTYFKKNDMKDTINREHILEGNRLILFNNYDGIDQNNDK